MSLQISKTLNIPYEYISSGDNSDPILLQATVDKKSLTVQTDVSYKYIIATTFLYTNIEIKPISEQYGIDWKVSLDGYDWKDNINVEDMDARENDQVLPLYLKSIIKNDGTVLTGNYNQCKIQITTIENP